MTNSTSPRQRNDVDNRLLYHNNTGCTCRRRTKTLSNERRSDQMVPAISHLQIYWRARKLLSKWQGKDFNSIFEKLCMTSCLSPVACPDPMIHPPFSLPISPDDPYHKSQHTSYVWPRELRCSKGAIFLTKLLIAHIVRG